MGTMDVTSRACLDSNQADRNRPTGVCDPHSADHPDRPADLDRLLRGVGQDNSLNHPVVPDGDDLYDDLYREPSHLRTHDICINACRQKPKTQGPSVSGSCDFGSSGGGGRSRWPAVLESISHLCLVLRLESPSQERNCAKGSRPCSWTLARVNISRSIVLCGGSPRRQNFARSCFGFLQRKITHNLCVYNMIIRRFAIGV